ncbi:class I SAM-dependent methyltransferase [Bermanella marisrubri]|uniref:class I SAM-dependent methyltransferase n=1 Tax=Bermanella marisrubri TaxID=207949 RepID=UPI001A9D2FFF|nr:class I SAM-dependent methyltransferase [Bermanella marisrubri]
MNRKSIQFYTRQNLASWDEAASIHHSINKDLADRVCRPDFNNLNSDFNKLLDTLDVAGKSIIQICCNNGIDLLSLKNKGSGYCLGVDGSFEFIKQARELCCSTEHAQIEFIQSDIYELPEDLFGRFDIVLVTVGVINWMPDLSIFFDICQRLLVDNGHVVMEEIHPVLNMFEQAEPSYLAYSYFDKEPVKDENGLDYFTNKKYQARPNYWFQYTLSDLFSCAISANLQLAHFKELPYNVGNYCADLEHSHSNPPLGFNALWQKRFTFS